MPRPAPRTVPVSRPITKLPPPPPSLSKRSYPSAISLLLTVSKLQILGSTFRTLVHVLGSRFRTQDALERDAEAAHEADDAAGLRSHVGAHAIGRVVDTVHRRMDRLVDALGLFFDPFRDGLDVVEDGVQPGHRRRDLAHLEPLDQHHHFSIGQKAADADA